MTTIRDFQALMRKIYFHRDVERGAALTYAWLIQEVGELGKALIRGDPKSLEDEAADCMAWLCSLCNVLNVDLEKVALMKYKGECPRCGKIPCDCPPF